MSKKEDISTENNAKKETTEEVVQSIIEDNSCNNQEPNHVSKKSWKVIAVAAVGILAGCALYSTLHPANQNSLQVVDRTIELGTKLDTLYDPQYWVKNGEDFSGATVAIQQKDKMRKEYLPVGTYNVVITKDDKNSKCQLKVEDTVAPVFTKTTKTITLTVGDKLNVKDYFHAKDLAKVDYSYNLKSKSSSTKSSSKKVDTTKEGKTDIVVTAKDASGNKTSVDCTVEVAKQEKKQEKTEDKKPAKDDAPSGTDSNSSSSSSKVSSNLGGSTSEATVSGGVSGSSSSSKPAQSVQQPSNNTSSSTNSQQPQPQPQPEPQPEPAPACEPVPAGAYTDYYAANEAAKQALRKAAVENGWFSSHYGVDTHQTNCGTIYYTYWYEEWVTQ